jgi:hypothetical protein
MMRNRYGSLRTAGRDALPFTISASRRWRACALALVALLLLSGCGAAPKAPTAPIRTHFEETAFLLPPIAPTEPWQRLSFNDWEQLRARAGLGTVPVSQWAAPQYASAVATLQSWLTPPSTIADADALSPVGLDAGTIRWQAGSVGPNGVPITRLVTGPAKDDRTTVVGNALANVGYARSPAAATPGAPAPLVYRRGANGTTGVLSPLIDQEAAGVIVTPSALLTVHDAARIPGADAALAQTGPTLDSVPLFHGLIAGISEVESFVLFRVGADGYRDMTAPTLNVLRLPFDALGAGLHITDAGARYVTLSFHVPALPGGRLPDGMADWWSSRFGLDLPDPRVEYLEAFGNDGWLFARYRILTADERLGAPIPGEIPFWTSVTTWHDVQQRWANFAPRTADPIPQLGR